MKGALGIEMKIHTAVLNQQRLLHRLLFLLGSLVLSNPSSPRQHGRFPHRRQEEGSVDSLSYSSWCVIVIFFFPLTTFKNSSQSDRKSLVE